jgi:hypothetical protein
MNAPKPSLGEVAARIARSNKYSLSDVRRGRLDVPQRLLGFGAEKVGKSTFASGAPDAVFICPENGTSHLDIERLPTPETWTELFDVLALVEEGKWKTIVIDPVNWLEDLAWAHLVEGPGQPVTDQTRDKIEKYGGGYKKGYEAAAGLWRGLIKELEAKHYAKGRNIVFLAHAFVKNFRDPSGVEYERYQPQMHEKAIGCIKQWVDDILFFRHEVLAKAENGKKVAVATGDHVIHTQWSKAWDAGNRSALPEELPMSWQSYWDAVLAGRNRGADLRKTIGELVEQLGPNTEVGKRATAAASAPTANAERLTEIANFLRMKLNEQTQEKNA